MGKDWKWGVLHSVVGGNECDCPSRRISLRRSLFALALATAMLVMAPTAQATEKLYWSDNGTQKIQRSNVDGTDVEDILTTGLNSPDGLAIDLPAGKLYWTDSGDGTINRSNLDGTNPETLVTGLMSPIRLVLDTANSKMYWTDLDAGKVQSADLDGTNVTDVVTGASGPWGIDLDQGNQHLYFTEKDALRITRVDTDGNNAFGLVNVVPSIFGGIKLLLSADSMYWTDRSLTARRMSTATIIGTNLDADRRLLTDAPDGITLDENQLTAYITTRTDPKIQTLALNGTGQVVTLLDSTDGLSNPRDITRVENQAPTALISYPVRIQEGGDATFDASGSTDPEGSPLYYGWDIDNDGDFDDATGATPTVDWTTLSGLGLSNGTSLVRVEVSDGIDTDVATSVLTIANDRLYWTDFGSRLIQSIDLDSLTVSDVFATGAGSTPQGIDYNPTDMLLYYVDQSNTDTIYSVTTSGTDQTLVISFPGDEAFDIAYDPFQERIYGTLRISRQIFSCAKDGTDLQTVVSFGSGAPTGIDLDPSSQHIYWVDSPLGRAYRIDYDGSNQVTIATGLGAPLGVSYDPISSHLYWTERSPGQVRRRPVDASGALGVATALVTGLTTPRSIIVDGAANRVYWAERGPDEIRYTSLDGALGVQTLASGLNAPTGVALVQNTRPMPNPGGAYVINEGASVFLDASGSSDAEGGTLSYAWDLDNDSDFDDATGVMPEVDWATLTALGIVDDVNDIAVEVTDSFIDASMSTTLTIVNLPPNASTGGPYTINEGQGLVLDATGTTDPGDDTIGLYEWDLDEDLDYDEATGAQPMVPWAALKTLGLVNGAYTIRVRATDSGNTTNLSDTSSTLLTVNNLPPVTDVFERSITKIQVLEEPAPGFLAAVTDPGDDPITIVSWDTESVFGAAVSVDQGTGAFTYDPSPSKTLLRLSQYEEVVDSFTYTVQDSETSTKALVTGTVNVIVSGDSGIPATGLLGRLALTAVVAALGGVTLRRRKR